MWTAQDDKRFLLSKPIKFDDEGYAKDFKVITRKTFPRGAKMIALSVASFVALPP